MPLAVRLAVWLLAGTVLAAPAAAAGWRITLKGEDVTPLANPRDAGGIPMIDVAALASRLGLVVRADRGGLSVRATGGLVWTGASGGDRLRSAAGVLVLERPLRVEAHSVYLPLGTAAEVSGLTVIVSAESRLAELAEAAAPASWHAFTLAKPVSELGLAAGPGAAFEPELPPDRESLRLSLGVGNGIEGDWGGDLSAAGSVLGLETRMSGLLASGPAGLELRSGRLALTDSELRLGAEAGELFSEVWGSTQGLRLLRERGGRSPRALSLYFPEGSSALLAWRDGFQLGRKGALDGELASDGSWLLRGRWSSERLSIFSHLREAAGRSLGLSGALDLAPGWNLQAGYGANEEERLRVEVRTLALRAPLPGGGDLQLESSGTSARSGRIRSDSLSLGVPVGDLVLRARAQRRNGQFELLASASWSGAAGLRVDVQGSSRWPEEGRMESWQQMAVGWKVSRRTSLQAVAALGSVPLAERLRLRLARELPRGFSLFAEGGEDRGSLRVMVSRTWEVGTPAGGGRVQGRVGEPGIPVRLGPYRTVTDPEGRYAFRHVPPGEYELALMEDRLPASFVAGGERRSLRVEGRSEESVDLPLQRLAEARGWVYVDRDGDGRRGPGEGQAGIVVLLDGRATRSGSGGSFAFANLPPGRHEVSVDAGRLPAGVAAAAPSRIAMGLPPGAVLDTLELRLVERRRAVVFQELR